MPTLQQRRRKPDTGWAAETGQGGIIGAQKRAGANLEPFPYRFCGNGEVTVSVCYALQNPEE